MRYSKSMKRGILATAAYMLALAALAGVSTPRAYASVNDFTVTSFRAEETLTRQDPQGELRIVEAINVDFTDNNHGLLRAIPNTYKKHRLLLHINKVSSPSGAPAQYTTYRQSGNTVLKIGDPNRTVTGEQAYVIDYTVHNVITFYHDHDELYWDVNGDQWTQQFGEVGVRLHLPNGAMLSRAPVCYAGHFGDLSRQCSVAATDSGRLLTAVTGRPLAGYETLSLVAGFKKGYFQPSTWYENVGEYGADIAVFLLPVLCLGGLTGWYWHRYGRDPKGRGVIVPEYGPPEDLGPIEVGTLIDFRTDNKDITAMVIDLAIRRYLTIVEQKQERLLRSDLTTYTLRLEKTGYGELNEFERQIMDDLFGGAEPGVEVDLAQKKYKLSATASVLRTTVRKSLETRGYFNPSAFDLRMLGYSFLAILAVGITAAVAAHYQAMAAFALGGGLGVVLAIFFIVFSSSRTAKGVAAKEQVQGLQLYLQVAEKDRINKLQSPDARYAANTREPKRTVQLFEKLLPYAMILGVEKQWAKQFEHLYRTPPDWYQGNWTSFNVAYLASSLNSGVGGAINTAFSSPSSASGSGFGGGGAGGGGGGGGGGGW